MIFVKFLFKKCSCFDTLGPADVLFGHVKIAFNIVLWQESYSITDIQEADPEY